MIVVRRQRILQSVPRWQWSPSQAIPKDEFGNDTVHTVFRVRARLHDGFVKWCGIFDDRDDFDAFLWAIVTGSLNYQPELWRLPTPAWYPGIGEELFYDFATVTFLTTTGGATYTSPTDWNNSNNSIEAIGAGASGGVAITNTGAAHSTGGGGGEYRRVANFSFASPGTTTASYSIGVGGTAVSITGTSGLTSVGVSGGDTTFNSTSLVAKGGSGGAATTVSGAAISGGAGGTGGTGAGGNYNGGSGGNTSFNGSSTGGGGAAGLNGAGNSGAAGVINNGQTAGGSGDAGFGGAGGVSTAGAGGAGTEWQVSPAYGSGGGGGSESEALGTGTAGSGGNYGGGGGSGAVRSAFISSTITSGAGRQGLLVVTYTPATYTSIGNLAMMGM